ncbi:MAG: ribosome silencing factor [Candidatus Omnitrophica bacterium]|nr:ribosome silencing factor [Candidatus Omnitrophota bacterium]
MGAKEKAILFAEALSDKKAVDLLVLDLTSAATFTDYFVISTGTSPTHLKAMSDNAGKVAGEKGIKGGHVEGFQEAVWILQDFGNVVIHLFSKEAREYYSLERLWGDVPRLPVNP